MTETNPEPSEREKLAEYENDLLDCCLALTSSLRFLLAQLDATKEQIERQQSSQDDDAGV